MNLTTFLFGLLDLPSVVAGHGYDVGRDTPASTAPVEDGGISMLWIVGGIALVLAVVGILLSLSPSTAKARLRRHAPKAVILAVIAAPLIAWTAASGGTEEKSLVVERWRSDAGRPELIVSLGSRDLNSLEMTNGKRTVRLECEDGDGDVVLSSTEKWPFLVERGYAYAHQHVRATEEQLREAADCRLLDTDVPLEAEVEGVLPG
jgi:hypothetical protein